MASRVWVFRIFVPGIDACFASFESVVELDTSRDPKKLFNVPWFTPLYWRSA